MADLEDKFRVSPKLLELGCEVYRRIEERDSMYRVSTFLLKFVKNNPFQGEIWLTDAIKVVLLTWHNAFYRYGLPRDFHRNFRNFVEEHEVLTLDRITETKARELFESLLDILKIKKKNGEAKSGVAVVKTLHLLRPDVFPLWDGYIANAYLGKGINFPPPRRDSKKLQEFTEYWRFKRIVDKQCEFLKNNFSYCREKEILYKKLDEVNYVLFTVASQRKEFIQQVIEEHFSHLVIEVKEELVDALEKKDKVNIYLKALESLAK